MSGSLRTIGIIGGMSWESTAHYYAAINQGVAQRMGGLHSAPILLDSLDFAPIAQLQHQGDWDKAGDILAMSARRLQEAGAQALILATNTMHVCAGRIADATSISLIHIADPTAEALKADGASRVGLLGTRFTMEMPFYRDRLTQAGLDPIIPDVGITDLNAIIYDQLCRGIVDPASRQTYVRAIERLAANGAQAVILGCTEIGMLISDDDSPIPTYDTASLHARAAVDFIIGTA